jgi:hypothetical protein
MNSDQFTRDWPSSTLKFYNFPWSQPGAWQNPLSCVQFHGRVIMTGSRANDDPEKSVMAPLLAKSWIVGFMM